MDNDVVILVTGILIITSLLPSVPSLVGSILEDFFDIFERLFLYTARQRGWSFYILLLWIIYIRITVLFWVPLGIIVNTCLN